MLLSEEFCIVCIVLGILRSPSKNASGVVDMDFGTVATSTAKRIE